MCDASCAVALTGTRFLVADDELNQLAVYDSVSTGPALQTIPLDALAGSLTSEADLEGAAELAGRVYWISSHGRTAKGAKSEARHRFFATEVGDEGEAVRITPVGRPVTDLVEALLEEPSYKDHGLRKAYARSPKEEGGLNIEGLAATREGGLVIGFRSPLVDGRALLAHLLNPADTIAGRTPRFAPPRLVDLGGLAVRSLEYWTERDLELVVAGPVDDGETFQLHVLETKLTTRRLAVPAGFAAEAVITFPGERSRVLLLSDDGAVVRSGVKTKKHPPHHPDRYFRSHWLTV